MFGIDYKERIKALWEWMKEQEKITKEFIHWIKQVQSTNDKRYNEINTRLKEMEDRENLYQRATVKCETCKCLLYKDDAIKGESRIVKKPNENFIGLRNSEWDGKHMKLWYTYPETEEIETPYYCPRCHKEETERKEIKLKEYLCQKKPLKSEEKSKQTKTTRSAKKSQSRAK